MIIRKAKQTDLIRIMEIYCKARTFMCENGNPTQWDSHYPSQQLVEKDIGKSLYVCTEQKEVLDQTDLPSNYCNEEIVCVFYFAVENDITYQKIYDGFWLNNKPYGVVHRIASSRQIKGAASFCLNWAYEQCGNLRIDTHQKNQPMQQLLKRLNFQYCGIIYTRDGSKRLAFQKIKL